MTEVTLIDSMGTDLSVVNAARVSFNKKSQWEKFIPGPGFGVPDTFEVLDKKPVNQNN